MTEIKCSLCPTVLIRCTNYTQVVPWVLIVCKNCSINGYLKREVMKTYELVENVVYEKENSEKVKMENELNQYKKRYYKNQNAVFDTLIKPSTYEFAQKFVKFRDNILDEEPQLQKTVKNCSEKILELTENQTKRAIIEEVKILSQTLKKEADINRSNVENVQKLGNDIKNKISTLAFECARDEGNPKDGKPIFTPDEINDLMSLFNKKTSQMDRKTGTLRQLFNEGDSILTAETHLTSVEKASSDIRKDDMAES